MKLLHVLAIMLISTLSFTVVPMTYAADTASDNAVKDTVTTRLDLNTATQSDFEALPGLGTKKAQAIVEYRAKVGGFLEVEQLTEVKGIGEKLLAKLQHRLEVKQTR